MQVGITACVGARTNTTRRGTILFVLGLLLVELASSARMHFAEAGARPQSSGHLHQTPSKGDFPASPPV